MPAEQDRITLDDGREAKFCPTCGKPAKLEKSPASPGLPFMARDMPMCAYYGLIDAGMRSYVLVVDERELAALTDEKGTVTAHVGVKTK